jgi:peptidoglycan/LPS O-acetylase OafA/YrhL
LYLGSPISWIYRIGTLRFLERYSYGIYVYHLLLLAKAIEGANWLDTHLHSKAAAAVLFRILWVVCVIVIAMLSYKFFESPLLGLKDKWAPSQDLPAGTSVLENTIPSRQLPEVGL